MSKTGLSDSKIEINSFSSDGTVGRSVLNKSNIILVIMLISKDNILKTTRPEYSYIFDWTCKVAMIRIEKGSVQHWLTLEPSVLVVSLDAQPSLPNTTTSDHSLH